MKNRKHQEKQKQKENEHQINCFNMMKENWRSVELMEIHLGTKMNLDRRMNYMILQNSW